MARFLYYTGSRSPLKVSSRNIQNFESRVIVSCFHHDKQRSYMNEHEGDKTLDTMLNDADDTYTR